MANADKTLLDKDEKEIYPITRERNVYDENNINLKTKFDNVVFKNDDIYVFAEEEKLKNESMINTNQFQKLTSSNVDIEEDYKFIKFTTKGTYAYADYYLDNLEVGETYTIGFNASTLDLSTRPRIFIGNKTTISDNSYRTFSLDKTSKHRISLTFEATTNILNFTFYINTTTLVENNFIEMSNITLAKGDKDILYVGKIVRTEDVEQIFLKNVFEESANELDVKELAPFVSSGVTISANNGTINYDGTATGFALVDIDLSGIDFKNKKIFTAFYDNSSNSNGVNVRYQLIAGDTWGSNVYQTLGANTSGKFDIPLSDNVSYTQIRIGINTNSIASNTKLSLAITDKEIDSFHQYNSASHITNGQADFLKSEWEKSGNLYDGINIKGNIVASNNTIDYNSLDRITSGTTYKVNPNSTYIVSFDNLDRYSVYHYNSKMEYIPSIHVGWQNSGTSFKTNEDTQYVRIVFSYSDDRVINSVNELTNVYFSVDGKIIHEKDIDPVLLWKNSTPTNEFVANQYYDLSETIKNGDILDIYFKSTANVYNLPEKTTIIVETSRDIYLSKAFSIGTANVYSRKITFSETQFYANDGYANDGVNNNAIIPYAIYKRRFM